MTADNYWPVYQAAIKELRELSAELEDLDDRRDKVDSRIAEVKKGVLALGSLCGQQPWVKHPDLFPEMSIFATMGLKPSVRTVLSRPPADWMSPVAIRNALKDTGYKTTSTNILPSVHTVLKRLAGEGEVETENRDGRTWYRWKGANAASVRPGESINDSLIRASRSSSDSLPKLKLNPLGKRVAERLKKKNPAWFERLKQSGGLVIANPPYLVDGTQLTRRQIREATEIIIEEENRREND